MICVVILTGCEHEGINKQQTEFKWYGQPIEIITIDSCEYIYVGNGNASWGSHKGNCKFCTERNKISSAQTPVDTTNDSE